MLQAVEVQIDDRGGVERQHLADDQAADDGDAERAAQFGAGAGAERQGEGAEQGGHGGHHDGTEAQHAGFEDGVAGVLAFGALRRQGEIDHHDGVFLDDADQQNDADDGDDAEVGFGDHQSEQRADARGRQRGKDGDGMDVALVEHAEHDVDGGERGRDEQGFAAEGLLVSLGSSGEGGLNGGGQADL